MRSMRARTGCGQKPAPRLPGCLNPRTMRLPSPSIGRGVGGEGLAEDSLSLNPPPFSSSFSAVCRLPSAICRLPSAVCRPPSAVCRLPFVHLPAPRPHLVDDGFGDGEGFGKIFGFVRGGEPGVPRRPGARVGVEVDAVVDQPLREARVEGVVVGQGVGPGRDRLAPAEVEPEARALALDQHG